MECLSPDQIRDRSERCVMEVESLLAAKALVGKPRARQWRFFRDAVEHPLLGNHSSEFEGISRVQAAQLKFEVEDKLRRFYLRPGHPPQFVFTLVHQSELGLYGVGEGDAYPPLAGYCVLVRDLSEDHVGEGQITGDDLSLYLGKVVTACVDAEFAAYAALPEIRLEEVRRWFCADGPAYREIANLVSRHQERGWVISNPMNPSTKRLLGTKVKRAAGPEAIVGTTEYWYLRWWGTRERTYVYPYRETNRQVYVLRKESDGWRVSQNLRPPPRSSVLPAGVRRERSQRLRGSGDSWDSRSCSQYCYSGKSRNENKVSRSLETLRESWQLKWASPYCTGQDVLHPAPLLVKGAGFTTEIRSGPEERGQPTPGN